MEIDQQKPSFMRQTLFAGLIFAVVIFLLEVFGGLMVINADPGGGVILITLFSGAVGCLVAAFAGMIGVRMYVKENALPMTLGEGAKIGLVTGAIVAAGNAFLDLAWLTVYPGFQDNLLEASIEHVEAITQISEEDRQNIIDMLYSETQEAASFGNILLGLFWSLLILGLLNTLSGTLGAKFFANQPGEEPEQG